MLYRTHQYPRLFPFKPFSTTPLPLLSPPPSIQVEQGMECVEEVELRNSFRTDELNGQNGGVSGDEFVVEDLLDFSTDGFFEAQKEEHEQEEEEEEEEDTKPCYSSPKKQEKQAERDTSFSAIDDFESAPCSGLSVPADDLADLEWLSHFVEDSFSEYSLTYPVGKLPEKTNENRSKPNEIPVQIKPSLMTPVHTKARSKRTRTGGRVWSLGSPSLTESSPPSSSSSSTTTTSSSSTLNRWLMLSSQSQTAESLIGQPQPAKRRKRKRPETAAFTAGGGGSQQPRRCSHCLVQKTPQWRTGPLGAKTLCNACGVRFKSGRLLPEYRPACSPTFSSEVHSNNHRKVMEMRRKKEVEEGLAQPVQSF